MRRKKTSITEVPLTKAEMDFYKYEDFLQERPELMVQYEELSKKVEKNLEEEYRREFP